MNLGLLPRSKKVFILMNSISKLDSFSYNTFWIIGGGQGVSKAFYRCENCTKSSYFDYIDICPKWAYFGEYYILL